MCLCPLCHTNTVPQPTWQFTDTSVEVETCAACLLNVGPKSVTMKVSGMISLALPATALRHRNALV